MTGRRSGVRKPFTDGRVPDLSKVGSVSSVEELIELQQAGRVNRRTFIRYAATLGAAAMTPALLAACARETAGSTTTAAGGSSVLDEVMAKMYPDGFQPLPGSYTGPNQGGMFAAVPSSFDGLRPNSDIRNYPWLELPLPSDDLKIGSAYFSLQWAIGAELAKRFDWFAELNGFEHIALDNAFDGEAAVTNADIFVQRDVDFVLEGQIFPDVNSVIEEKFRAAGIPAIYYAVEGPDNALFGDNDNYAMCRDLGIWLGEYARDEWSGQVDLVILEAQPRAGEWVGAREVGYRDGIKSVLPDLSDDVFVEVDSEGVLQVAQTVTADVLTAHPGATNILVTGTNDDAAIGGVRALEQAGRTEFAAAAGQAGQESAITELERGGESVFKVTAAWDLMYNVWLLAVGVASAAGIEVPEVHFLDYDLYTADNIGDIPAGEGARLA